MFRIGFDTREKVIQLSPLPVPPQNNSPKRPWGLIIGLGVAAFVAAVLLLVLLFAPSGNGTQTSNTAQPGVSAPATSDSPSPSDTPSQTASPTPSPTDSASDSATPTATPTPTPSATKAPQPTGPKSTVTFRITTPRGSFRVNIVRQPAQHFRPDATFGAAAITECGYTPSDTDVVVPITITVTNVTANAYSPGLGVARHVMYDLSHWEDNLVLAITGCPQPDDRANNYTLGYISADVLAPGKSQTFTGYLIAKGGYDSATSTTVNSELGDVRIGFGLNDGSVSGISGYATQADSSEFGGGAGAELGFNSIDMPPRLG